MHIQERIAESIKKNNSLLCVGLDSDTTKLPEGIQNKQFEFNKAIIDATHDFVCGYKPNTAFYEGDGVVGIEALKKTCDYLRSTYPELLVILDAKRGDIGNTNSGYLKFAFDYLGADAITVHPYLGKEALQPFLDREDKGCIILCKTSNPGSSELQNTPIEESHTPFYQYLATKVATEWNEKANCLLVVGATYPKELAKVREITGEMTFLIPGIGAQGGDVEQTVKAGKNSHGTGMIINASRSVIFASSGNDFSEQARIEAEKLKNSINSFR